MKIHVIILGETRARKLTFLKKILNVIDEFYKDLYDT